MKSNPKAMLANANLWETIFKPPNFLNTTPSDDIKMMHREKK
jgi:hypothetical protein